MALSYNLATIIGNLLMNIFFEEDGGFKVGTILSDNTTSLQVENLHGKRSKIKAAHVMLRFSQPGLNEFMAQAEQIAAEMESTATNAVEALELASLYTALGRNDDAYRWIAFEPDHAWTPWAAVDPILTIPRDDPRFPEFLERYHLPRPDRDSDVSARRRKM